MGRGRIAAAVALVALLAALGAVPAADNVTHRVMALVHELPWSAAWGPHWNPPPMGAWSVRPLSVLLLKLLDLMLDGSPPRWVLWLKAWLCLLALGFGGQAWLRAHKLPSWPAWMVLLLTPTLFSAWLLPELDALGAGALLGGCALLSRGRWWPAGALLAFALLLKESSAVVALAVLSAELIGRRQRRWLVPLALGGLLWLGFLLTLPAGEGDPAHWSTRLPVLEHSAVQLLYLASPAGAVLLLLGPLRRPVLAWIGLAGLLIAPVMVSISYYEAVYYAPRTLALGLTGALLLGLLLHLPRYRTPVLAVLLPWAALALIMLVGPTPREDLASRLMLVVAVPLAGLSWAAVERLFWGPHRVAVGALAAALGWYAVASTFNSAQDLRARAEVDGQGRALLASQDLTDGIVLFDNHSEWVGPEELAALGSTTASTARFSSTPGWLSQTELPLADWGHRPIHAEREWHQGTPIWLYFLGPNIRDGEGLTGDFAWNRRSWGVLESILDGPNLLEQKRFSETRPLPSPLERLAAERGALLLSAESHTLRLPVHLTELPRRALTGLPVLERVTWRAALYSL